MLEAEALWAQLHWPEGRPVLLAFSGGGDSLALLHLWLGSPWPLQLVHLDHGEGGQQALAVQQLADRFALPLHRRRLQVARWARRYGMSWEAAGRWLRYRWLQALASQLGGLVLTGHHADDQAETLLIRLLQGTTLDGLAGIHPRTAWLARPLLGCRRQQLQEYLRQRGVHWYEDPANRQGRFLRVQVRQKLLPLMESLNPRAVEHLARLAADAWEGQHGHTPRRRFEQLLFLAWQQLAPLGARWERFHAEAVWSGLQQARGSWNLPGRCWVEWTPRSLWVGVERPRLPPLGAPGEGQEVRLVRPSVPWEWRQRQPGDRWGQQWLKDVMQARGMPRRWRDQVGVLASGTQVGWVEGWDPHPESAAKEKGPAQSFWLAPWRWPIRLEDCPRPCSERPDR